MSAVCSNLIILSIFFFSQILNVYGQGFGQPISPFGQQAFGGNVFIPQNFPSPIDQTIDLERQGSFSISPPDGAAGVQLLETTVSDGNQLLFRDGGQGGQGDNTPGQNFGQQGFPQNFQRGQQTTFFTQQGIAGFPNPNQQVRFVQGGGTGNPFPGIQRPTASLMPFQGNTNPFLGPPTTPTGNLLNNIITGIPGNFQGSLPTAVPSTQIDLGQSLPQNQFQQNQGLGGNQFQSSQGFPGGQFQGNQGLGGNQFQGNQVIGGQFQGNQGVSQLQQNQGFGINQFQANQRFQGGQFQGGQFQGNQILPGTQFQGQTNQQFQGFQQGVLPTGVPGTNDVNAVNSITGSDTFDERFNLIDPTTNAAVQDISNPGVQNQQGQFQMNQNFQQPPQNNIFSNIGPQTPFQSQGQFRPTQQSLNRFSGSFQNTIANSGQTGTFGNQLGSNPPQFIGNQGGFLPRSEFAQNNDIRTSSNSGFQSPNRMNFTQVHPQDPSIGVFLTDSLISGLDPNAGDVFSKFGQRGFTDVSIFQPRPTPFPNVMNTPPGFTGKPGFTTMSSPPTTTEGYKCQHSPCPKGQACVYDGKYKCPDWITLLDCKCLSGCMYNNWFIPKKFVIPIDHCGNHCSCERDDGVATCSKTKCPDAP